MASAAKGKSRILRRAHKPMLTYTRPISRKGRASKTASNPMEYRLTVTFHPVRQMVEAQARLLLCLQAGEVPQNKTGLDPQCKDQLMANQTAFSQLTRKGFHMRQCNLMCKCKWASASHPTWLPTICVYIKKPTDCKPSSKLTFSGSVNNNIHNPTFRPAHPTCRIQVRCPKIILTCSLQCKGVPAPPSTAARHPWAPPLHPI